LNYDRGFKAEVDVFEFPVTVEDEHPPKLGERLQPAIELADKLSKYGGIYVILIHPDILGHKLDFLRGFVTAVKDSAWFGTISEFGHWWSVRNNIELDVNREQNRSIVELEIPERSAGLTLEVPRNYRFESSQPETLQISQLQDRVLIRAAEGKVRLVFQNSATN
jgi:hypothetical protein